MNDLNKRIETNQDINNTWLLVSTRVNVEEPLARAEIEEYFEYYYSVVSNINALCRKGEYEEKKQTE